MLKMHIITSKYSKYKLSKYRNVNLKYRAKGKMCN